MERCWYASENTNLWALFSNRGDSSPTESRHSLWFCYWDTAFTRCNYKGGLRSRRCDCPRDAPRNGQHGSSLCCAGARAAKIVPSRIVVNRSSTISVPWVVPSLVPDSSCSCSPISFDRNVMEKIQGRYSCKFSGCFRLWYTLWRLSIVWLRADVEGL